MKKGDFMNNKNSNELNDINEKLKKTENLALPESLSKESVTELLKDEKPIKTLPKKAVYRRALAFAAVLAIIFTSLIHIRPWQEDDTRILPTGKKNYSGKVEVPNSPESYEQLEGIFIKYQRANYAKSLKSYFFNGRAKQQSEAEISEDAIGEMGADLESAGSLSNADESRYGKTNEQVKGVNEADIIKNDGTYLYMVFNKYYNIPYGVDEEKTEVSAGSAGSSDTSQSYDSSSMPYVGQWRGVSVIAIIKPSKNGKMEVISIINAEIDDGVERQDIINMYVKGDMLHAIYSVYDSKEYKSSTLAITFDITDRQNPVEVRRFYQSGSHISSRLIGDSLVLITNHYVTLYENSDIVKNNCIPETGVVYRDVARLPSQNICVMDNVSSPSYLVVSNINLIDTDKEPATAAILGGGENVYCTTEKLYVTNGKWNSNFATAAGTIEIAIAPSGEANTTIYSFDITAGNVIYKANNTVDGYVLNQFSIDEYNGHLRIATTTGSFDKSNNFVYVLSADTLKQAGVIKDISPGETIKSVRFMGDRGYVVTFLQTDPLFVLDLSKPDSPKILGELKITGFSSYLHPITPTLLIGIGVDGTEEGQNNSLKVSLFDVSDPSKPKEIDKSVFGDNNQFVHSVAYYDHKAICYDEDTKTLYFPIEIVNYLATGNTFPSYYGVIGLKIDVQNKKFSESANYLLNHSAQSSVIRSTYIDNLLFAFSNDSVSSFDRATVNLLSQIDFNNYEIPESFTPRLNKPETTTETTTEVTTETTTESTTESTTEPITETQVGTSVPETSEPEESEESTSYETSSLEETTAA